MGIIGLELRVLLQKWKAEKGAQSAPYAELSDSKAEAEETVAVFVETAAETTSLTESGLSVGSTDGAIVTGHISLARVEALSQRIDVYSINISPSIRPVIDRSMPDIEVDKIRSKAPPYYSTANARAYTGKGVLIGVIDDAIYERHQSFLKPSSNPRLSKSRIVGIWDQLDIKKEGRPNHHRISTTGLFGTRML